MRAFFGKLILVNLVFTFYCKGQVANSFSDVAFISSLTRATAAPSGCTTEAQAEGDTAHFDDAVDWTAFTWQAVSFVAGSSFTVCKAQAYLYQQGTDAPGTLQVLIYDDNAGVPGSILGSASATVDRT